METTALPADIGRICLGHRTRMAARAVTRAFNARLRPLGLQITQFSLLVAVGQQLDRSLAAMGDRLDIESSALQRNITILEKRGLIASEGGRGPKGRRLRLTAEGRHLLGEAAPIWAKAQVDLTQALGSAAEETRTALSRLEAAALGLEAADRAQGGSPAGGAVG